MKTLLMLMLFGSYVHAETLNLKVENFNFTYTDPKGDGSATSFRRNQLLNSEVFVRVDKVDTSFRLLVTGAKQEEFEFKDAPSFMTDAKSMNVTGFNLNFSNVTILSLGSGRFVSEKDTLGFDGVSVNCVRPSGIPEVMDQVLLGCIQSMALKSSRFSQEGLRINSLDLKTSNGRFDLTADIKAEISGKVRSRGNMAYDPKTGIATIKISEVKFGILNVTSKVFDALKKKESDKFKVKEPFLYYNLK